MKFNGLLCIVCSVICAVFIGSSDAVVSGWTEPTISGMADGTGTYTKTEADTTIDTLACTVVGTAAYAILEQPASALLAVGASTGVLAVATGKKLDFETEPTYVLKVTCTDDDDDAVGTATITLTVTDVNEAPEFGASQYSLTIPNGSTAGTTLTTVTATDQDTGDTIAYSITTASDPDTDFAISSSGGVITVATGKTLTRSTTGGYGLVVHAVDNDGTPLTGSTTVYVVVKTCGASVAMVGVMTLALVAISMFV